MSVRPSFEWRVRGKVISLGSRTCVMGILNVTQDSFSGDGVLLKRNYVAQSVKLAARMFRQGADIIDVGGESTRPGAGSVSAKEEVRRIIPVIEAILSTKKDAVISVDTSKAYVAGEALRAGAHIINVVQGNKLSEGLLNTVKQFDAGLVLMHMRGTPRSMQNMTGYGQVTNDVVLELRKIVGKAVSFGIGRASIVIDPGIGFAKTVEQNYQLIHDLSDVVRLGFPVLVGVSRKSFIGKLLNLSPDKRLAGTLAAVVACIINGAHIVRVHDCQEVSQAVLVTDAILAGGK